MQSPNTPARLNKVKELLADNLRWTLQSLGGLSGRTQLLDDEKFVVLQVGKAVFNQAPRQMRVELWLSSLQRKGVGTAAAAKYEDMLRTPISEEAASDIDKDLARTFPNTKRFAAAEGQAALRRVLRGYAAYDPEVGYCQGMNFVAGLLLMFMPSEAHAFGALVMLMEDRGLRKYFSVDMSLLQTHLWQLGRLMPPSLCSHMESVGVLPMLYAASWLMTCFSADFPYSFSARVMDVVMADKMDQALLKAAVTLLSRAQRRLMALTDLEDVLTYLKLELPAWEEQALHDALTEAFATPWTARQLALLGSTEGAESVAEALDRVQKANLAAAGDAGEDNTPASPHPATKPPPPITTATTDARQQAGSSEPGGAGRRLSGPGSSSMGRGLLPPPPAPARRISSTSAGSSRGGSPLPSRDASASDMTMHVSLAGHMADSRAAAGAWHGAAGSPAARVSSPVSPGITGVGSFYAASAGSTAATPSFLADWDPFDDVSSYQAPADDAEAAVQPSPVAIAATAALERSSSYNAGAPHAAAVAGAAGFVAVVGALTLENSSNAQQQTGQQQTAQHQSMQQQPQGLDRQSVSSGGDWVLVEEHKDEWGDFAAARRASSSLPSTQQQWPSQPASIAQRAAGRQQQQPISPQQQASCSQQQQQQQQGASWPERQGSWAQQQDAWQQVQPREASAAAARAIATSKGAAAAVTAAAAPGRSATSSPASPASPSKAYQPLPGSTPGSPHTHPQPAALPAATGMRGIPVQDRGMGQQGPYLAEVSPSASYQELPDHTPGSSLLLQPQPGAPSPPPSMQSAMGHDSVWHGSGAGALGATNSAGVSPSASYQVLPDGSQQEEPGLTWPVPTASASQKSGPWCAAEPGKSMGASSWADGVGCDAGAAAGRSVQGAGAQHSSHGSGWSPFSSVPRTVGQQQQQQWEWEWQQQPVQEMQRQHSHGNPQSSSQPQHAHQQQQKYQQAWQGDDSTLLSPKLHTPTPAHISTSCTASMQQSQPSAQSNWDAVDKGNASPHMAPAASSELFGDWAEGLTSNSSQQQSSSRAGSQAVAAKMPGAAMQPLGAQLHVHATSSASGRLPSHSSGNAATAKGAAASSPQHDEWQFHDWASSVTTGSQSSGSATPGALRPALHAGSVQQQGSMHLYTGSDASFGSWAGAGGRSNSSFASLTDPDGSVAAGPSRLAVGATAWQGQQQQQQQQQQSQPKQDWHLLD